MRIEQISLREIRMPLVTPFETSFARMQQRRILLLQVRVDGLEGWGEVTCGEGPFYNAESTDLAALVLKDFAVPMVLGREFAEPGDVARALEPIRGHRMAKAAIENAVWAAEAERQGVPLWQLLGGTRREIACGVSIGIKDSAGELLEAIARELEAGYQRIKIKIKPGWDVEIVGQVRRRFPKIALSADANSAFRPDDAPLLRALDEFGLMMIEQPLWDDDIQQHALLQRQLRTPLCLDESIHHVRDAEEAIACRACGMINIKLGRVGGFSSARAVHDAALKAAMPVWCGGMLESGVGRAANIAMSTLANFSLPGDVSASRRYWHEDIIDPEVSVSARGTISAPSGAGLGYVVRRKRIDKLTAWEQTFRPT
ncbi:MAG: o-succinylbenzoate synthase [Terriglobales bacterium]